MDHVFKHALCQECTDASAVKVTQNPEWSRSAVLDGVLIAPYEVCVDCYEEIKANYRDQAEADDADAL